jgi:hypothetical protein
MEFYNGYGKIDGGFQWGAGLEIGISPTNAVEIIYQQFSTSGFVTEYFNNEVETGDVNFNYVLVGGTGYLPINDVLSGFGSMDIGLAIIAPAEDVNVSNTTKFAWGLRGGLRIMPAERFSIRIHAQLLSPVQAAGGGFWFGTGGSGVGVSTYSTMYQFNLGGSLNIRLN